MSKRLVARMRCVGGVNSTSLVGENESALIYQPAGLLDIAIRMSSE
jgi:hypothetical protein